MPSLQIPGAALRLLALALLVAGCGGTATVATSAEDAYARGAAALEARRYERAIEHFRASLDFGRTGERAADAQLGLARAYAGSRQFLLAGTEFTRFVEFYRTDPRVPEAAFERIQAYVALSPRVELDQTDTVAAIGYIEAYLRQYPASENAGRASELLAGLREKLAEKELLAGQLYERREMFEAAVVTYRNLLATYPSSAFADDAMLGTIRAQVRYADNSVAERQEARYREALRMYDQFVTLFPQSDRLREAEAEYERAFRGAQAAAAVAATTAAG